MLYQGALTAAVRIQAGRQQIGAPSALRRRMKDVIAEIDREALKRNYTTAQTSETHFAFIAFLDEVILNSDDPMRDEWAKKPLQEEVFGVSTAGEQFFHKLEHLLSLPDSPELTDVFEVFLLCLLLGFQGRYIRGSRAELDVYTRKLEQRLERTRGQQGALSPQGLPKHEPHKPAAPSRNLSGRWTWTIPITAAALCFILFAFDLTLRVGAVENVLLRTVTP